MNINPALSSGGDFFRIKTFRDVNEARDAEDKLKEAEISAVLTNMHELYVSTGQLDKVIDTLGLSPEVRKAPQPGPWCPWCGQQLISEPGAGKTTRLRDIASLIPWLPASSQRWYCHACKEEIKDIYKTGLMPRPIKRALVSMRYHSKPDFIVIGAQKAGTTALFRILSQHPQIAAPAKKELHFFDDVRIKYGDYVSYHEMFPLPCQLKPDRLTFEVTPSYLYNPDCPLRIYRYSPGIRLIVILREPVSRAFSAWNMYNRFIHSTNPYLKQWADHRSFEEAISQEARALEKTEWKNNQIAYVKRGLYVEQLEKYLKHFSRDSLLILEYSDFLHDPQAFCARVFRFLQVDDRFVIRTLRTNVSTSISEIPKKVRDILHSIYTPYNRRLFSLLGKEYDW